MVRRLARGLSFAFQLWQGWVLAEGFSLGAGERQQFLAVSARLLLLGLGAQLTLGAQASRLHKQASL
jgi:flagellar biogenesis protein FliO